MLGLSTGIRIPILSKSGHSYFVLSTIDIHGLPVDDGLFAGSSL